MSKVKLCSLCLGILLVLPCLALAAGTRPTISGISPTGATAGSATLVLTVNGSGFVRGSVVLWNGSGLTTTYVNFSQLKATVPSTALASAGGAVVTVYVAGRAGGTSNSVAFTISAATTTTTTTTTTSAPLAISTTSIPIGTTGTAYSTALTATGGTSPYTWSVTSGGLPAGLTLSSAGAISGTPTTSGSASFMAQVKDSASNVQTYTYSTSIAAGTTTPLSISTASLPAATAGTAYASTSLAATGGTSPYTWSVASGSTLPAGLTLSSSGVLSGTPTAADTYSFSVQTTDSASNTATKSYSLTVAGTTVANAVYADWSGIDAMAVPTTYYGDTSAQGIQIGSSVWQWQKGNSNHTTSLTVTNSTYEPLCPAGHNCIVLQYNTADGTNGFPNYIYLTPTYSGWSGNPPAVNGSSASGGIWTQFYFVVDSNTYTYINNASAQIKIFLNRSDPSSYSQANALGGFFEPIIGLMCGAGWPNYTCIYDDPTTGSTIYAANSVNITSGTLIRGHFRYDATANLGHFSVSSNGTLNADTETGLHAPKGGMTALGNTNGNIASFTAGIRYFAACTNGCANTTLKFVLSNVEVANYNFAGFP